jgi:hypothetical protein
MMMHLGLPHVNVLSKMDLLDAYWGWGKKRRKEDGDEDEADMMDNDIPFGLEFYTSAMDPHRLVDQLLEPCVSRPDDKENEEATTTSSSSSSPFPTISPSMATLGLSPGLGRRYVSLHRALADLIHDFQFVQFVPLCVEDTSSLLFLVRTVDRANGCIFSVSDHTAHSLLSLAQAAKDEDEMWGVLEERYVESKVGKNEREDNNDGNDDDDDDMGLETDLLRREQTAIGLSGLDSRIAEKLKAAASVSSSTTTGYPNAHNDDEAADDDDPDDLPALQSTSHDNDNTPATPFIQIVSDTIIEHYPE